MFVYPKPALLGRIVPKAKIYQFACVNTATKELFVNQVESIVWQYKLAPETINLPATDFVTEIEIFDIHLKMKEFDNTVLDCIDKGIAFPLIFQCHFENQTKIMACYKRPSESDSEKWVTSEYFSTPWFDNNNSHPPLPMVLDLGALYAQMIRQLIPLAAREGENIKQQLERNTQLQAKQKEQQKLQQRLNSERQFNRKVELNRQLNQLKITIDALLI